MSSSSSTTFTEKVRSNPLHGHVSQILYWEDLAESGLIFALFNLFFFLIIFGEYNPIALVATTLFHLLIISAAFVIFKGKQAEKKGDEFVNPLEANLKDINFKADTLKLDQHLELLLYGINIFLHNFKEALLCHNILLTLQFVGGLFIAAILGTWFSTTTLIYFGLLFGFIWPRLYHEKQEQIDQYAGQIKQRAADLTSQVVEKLPPNIKEKIQ
eukprot:TRINITY_DN6227_c0_g1_i1.p1 TRINITY_DN6227_c0_g1~~TRINITY_DN6227_c0_g1_i1.p1  ORF type:complete len:214 (-),score=42.46 TRINITY_DN6227_c0_g1_i1:27-668(-)